jgi:dTDP-4-dehydrorhamnose 3,5-epimerase
MPYTVTPTCLPEVLVLEPQVFGDARGLFFESFSERDFAQATGLQLRFVQDNQSHSRRGVLRGLHYQLPPRAQGKLVRCASGAVFDVAVDLRTSSPRRGQWTGVELSAANRKQLWVPPGFAHGFLVLSESADLLYKTTDYYAPGFEASLRWDDPTIAIDWPESEALTLAEKDRCAPLWGQASVYEG